MVPGTFDDGTSLAVAEVEFWPRGEDAHSFQGVQNRRGLFSLLSFNLQQIEPLLQSNLFVASRLIFGRLPSLFQADFPNINICQKLTQSRGCKIALQEKEKWGQFTEPGERQEAKLELAGRDEGAEVRWQQSPGWEGGDGAAKGGVWICPTRVSATTLQNPPSFFNFYKFIYLFLAALGLRCCSQAFSSCGDQGLLFVAVRRLLIVVASLVVEHGL